MRTTTITTAVTTTTGTTYHGILLFLKPNCKVVSHQCQILQGPINAVENTVSFNLTFKDCGFWLLHCWGGFRFRGFMTIIILSSVCM